MPIADIVELSAVVTAAAIVVIMLAAVVVATTVADPDVSVAAAPSRSAVYLQYVSPKHSSPSGHSLSSSSMRS